MNNITKNIESKIGRNLHNKVDHPLYLVKRKVYDYFKAMIKFDGMDPYMSVENNFDNLLIPKDHVSRGPTDTYYKDKDTVLRTHMTSHLAPLVTEGYRNFLTCGDVYRKDTVDATHSPVFHQIDGFSVLYPTKDALEELRKSLGGLVEHLFPGKEYRFSEDYFPFTDPSIEVEVKFGDDWLEILGGGVVHREILDTCGVPKEMNAIAFGLGLERLAMIMYDIPDIRLFWTEDDRFLSQFGAGRDDKFVPYSKCPDVERDMSMWIPEGYHEHDFFDIVRDVAEDMIASVTEIDKFVHPKTGRESRAYHFVYRSHDLGEGDYEVVSKQATDMHNEIVKVVTDKLKVEVR